LARLNGPARVRAWVSLVHGIVADFGGAIDVVTQVGAGTTFTIWLPATNAAGPPRGNGEAVIAMPVSDCFD
jgi:hypothetical protein